MTKANHNIPLSEREEEIASIVVDSAFTVHSVIGPGLLERIYEACFCRELEKRGLSYQRQIVVPISYDNLTFEEGFRLDVLVENKVVCGLKAVEIMYPVCKAQLLSYLKLTGKRLGFLINFNVPLIKYGIHRVIQ